ncbi:hypothetical protein ACJX0J_012676, partial [Zea mays]
LLSELINVASSILLVMDEHLDLFHLAIIFLANFGSFAEQVRFVHWTLIVIPCAIAQISILDSLTQAVEEVNIAYATEVLSDGIVDDKKLQKMKSNILAVTCVWFILSKLASIFIIIKLRILKHTPKICFLKHDCFSSAPATASEATIHANCSCNHGLISIIHNLNMFLEPHLLWSLDQSISTSSYDYLKAQQFLKTNTDITYLFFTHFICFGSPSFYLVLKYVFQISI